MKHAVSLLALIAGFSGLHAPAVSAQQPVGERAGQSGPFEDATLAYRLFGDGDAAGAIEPARRAVAGDPSNLDWRLLLVDALLAEGRAGEAFDALSPVAGLADYRVQTRLAQAAEGAGRKADAVGAYGRAAPLATDPAARAYLIRARILGLVELDRRAEARAAFDLAWREGQLAGHAPLDTAMLAIAVGDDRVAQDLFRLADGQQPIRGRVALDAGYSARRLGREGDAIFWFRRGLDSARAGEFTLDPQREHEIRREVETLERRWGAVFTVGQGAAGVDVGATGSAPRVTQAGIEAYWRVSGDNDGRPLDLFARAYGVLDAEGGWPSGSRTAQGWVGVRWRPLRDTNLVLEGSRMVALGDLARDDTMLRASWSAEDGGDLRFDRSSWPSWRLYGDLAYIVGDEQTLGVGEARAGWTWRAGRNDMVTPYAALRVGYDSRRADETVVTIGPGVAWRHWFREGEYSAPASYLDLWLAYDFDLSGDGRGEGLVVGGTVRY